MTRQTTERTPFGQAMDAMTGPGVTRQEAEDLLCALVQRAVRGACSVVSGEENMDIPTLNAVQTFIGTAWLKD